MLIFQNETTNKMVSVNINRNNKNTIFVKGDMDGATMFIELSSSMNSSPSDVMKTSISLNSDFIVFPL